MREDNVKTVINNMQRVSIPVPITKKASHILALKWIEMLPILYCSCCNKSDLWVFCCILTKIEASKSSYCFNMRDK